MTNTCSHGEPGSPYRSQHDLLQIGKMVLKGGTRGSPAGVARLSGNTLSLLVSALFFG